jgi:hypothetical protein
MNNTLLSALLFVLGINLLMWISQAAIIDMGGSGSWYTSQGILENENISASTSEADDLPTTGGAVETDTGNIFVDTFGVFTGWIADSWVVKILKAPYNYLKMLGIDPALAAMLGTMWYIITVTLILLVSTGRI